MDADFCVWALEEALAKYGKPDIFNTDQGRQFTSFTFTNVLQDSGIRISMDDRGRWLEMCLSNASGAASSTNTCISMPLNRTLRPASASVDGSTSTTGIGPTPALAVSPLTVTMNRVC